MFTKYYTSEMEKKTKIKYKVFKIIVIIVINTSNGIIYEYFSRLKKLQVIIIDKVYLLLKGEKHSCPV